MSTEPVEVGSVWSMVAPAEPNPETQVFIDGMKEKLTPEAIARINKCLDELKEKQRQQPLNQPDLSVRYE